MPRSQLTHHVRTHTRLCAALLALTALTLSGCSTPVPTPDPVTISFTHLDFYTEIYEGLVAEFNEQYPYIIIELMPQSIYDTFDSDEINATQADVFLGSALDIRRLRAEDAILSLEPFVIQDPGFDQDDFYPNILDLFKDENELWGVPEHAEIMVMYYNRDLFDLHGEITYPTIGWTWDEFLDDARALRDPEGEVFGYMPLAWTLDGLTFVYQHGGQIVDDWHNPTRAIFDDQATLEALEWYADLIHEYDVVASPQEMEAAFGRSWTRDSAIYQSQVGMWTGWFSQRGQATWGSEWVMDWGMVPLPEDEQAATLAVGNGYFISSAAQNPEACWQWISFLSRQLPSTGVPARRSVAESPAFDEEVGDEFAAVARASMENALLIPPQLTELEDVGYLAEAINRVIIGEASAAEALYDAQRQAEN